MKNIFFSILNNHFFWKCLIILRFLSVVKCSNKRVTLFLNSNILFKDAKFDCGHKFLQSNFHIFGQVEKIFENRFYIHFIVVIQNSIFFSPFGEFTDVNIWSKELDHEEVKAWGNFDKLAPPDLVNWSNATLNIRNLVKEEITQTDIKQVFFLFSI